MPARRQVCHRTRGVCKAADRPDAPSRPAGPAERGKLTIARRSHAVEPARKAPRLAPGDLELVAPGRHAGRGVAPESQRQAELARFLDLLTAQDPDAVEVAGAAERQR